MSLRPPARYANSAVGGAGATALNQLDHEIAGEKAAALGRAGERVEKSLTALAAMDRDDPRRVALLRTASQAVHAYFIQREMCGMRRHHDAIRDYAIPREVLVRLGAS